MYGHAHESMPLCQRCPAYAAKYAIVIEDDGTLACGDHATLEVTA